MSHQSIFEDCWEDAETRVAGLEDHLRLERVVDERFRVVGDEPGQPRTFFARDVQDGAEVTLRLGLDGLEEERDRAEVERDRSDFERACVALLEVAGFVAGTTNPIFESHPEWCAHTHAHTHAHAHT